MVAGQMKEKEEWSGPLATVDMLTERIQEDGKPPKPFKDTTCLRCGFILDVNPYGPTNEDVVIMASDHATKDGCGWACHNVEALTEFFFKKPKARGRKRDEEEEDEPKSRFK